MTVKIFEAPYNNRFDKPSNYYSNNGDGFMRNGEFFFTSEKGSWFNSDWLIVPENPYACFMTDIPRERRILFVLEPPEIHGLIPYFIEQFGYVVSLSPIPDYSGRTVIANPKLGWTAGLSGELSTYGKAMNYPLPQKLRTLSMISSLKHKTEYHRKRIHFMRELQREFSGVIDCYGREFNPVDDKISAITTYKYHVVIENSKHENYHTEKLTDAWVCWSLPIYFGDPKILEHVPDKNGIEIINVDDVEGSIAKIHEIVDNDVYLSRIEAIRKCREWALKESNMYETACDIITKSNDNTPKLKTPELLRRLVSSRKNSVYNAIKLISTDYADKIFTAYHRMKGRFWE